jgi:hypothetical protein
MIVTLHRITFPGSGPRKSTGEEIEGRTTGPHIDTSNVPFGHPYHTLFSNLLRD